MKVQSIEWLEKSNTLRLLDQKILPERVKYLELASVDQIALAIKDLTVRGAPAIGVAAAFALVMRVNAVTPNEVGSLVGVFEEAFDTLLATRPTAVNLGWALNRLKVVFDGTKDNLDACKRSLLAEARAIEREDIEVNHAISRHALELLPEEVTFFHICNTGSLATVEHGTALGIIVAAHRSGRKVKAYLCETRPRLQGAKLSSWELMQHGVDNEIVVDGAAAHIMRTQHVDLCVVGCDRVAANGDVANKIGTYSLALAAKDNGVPFYVAAPTSTVDCDTGHGDAIDIEYRDEQEVTSINEVAIAPPGARAANPAFDVTPARLVTGIITENGIAREPYAASLRPLVGLESQNLESKLSKADWTDRVYAHSQRIRLKGFDYVLRNGGGYLSQICSAAELMAFLYARALNLGASIADSVPGAFVGTPGRSSSKYTSGGQYNGPHSPEYDRFYFSPAHYALVMYVTLIEFGRLAPESLEQFNIDGSRMELIGAEHSPGFESTTGSLGQALSQGIGVALARRRRNEKGNVWVMMSDGEFQEGQTWEALQAISHYKLSSINIIVDVNGQQCDGSTESVMDISNIAERCRAFGVDAHSVDGHDLHALDRCLSERDPDKALIILAHTDPARGVPLLNERAPNLHYLRFKSSNEQARYQEFYSQLIETVT